MKCKICGNKTQSLYKLRKELKHEKRRIYRKSRSCSWERNL